MIGESFEIGGSGGVGFSVGGEVGILSDHLTNETKMAVNLNIGGGITPPGFPLEGHAGITTSRVDKLFNIFEAWNAIVKGYNMW